MGNHISQVIVDDIQNEPPASIIRGQNYISKSLKNASSQAVKKYENYSLKNGGPQGRHFVEETPRGMIYVSICICMCIYVYIDMIKLCR